MKHRDSGQILPTFGVLLVVLVGFLAMGIDLGQGYLQRRDNQNAADAASIAGYSALIAGASDANVKGSITHILTADGYSSSSIVYLTSSSPNPGTDVSKVYADAEYGKLSSTNSCVPLASNKYVGSVGGNPPPTANCIHLAVTTSKATLFAKVPILGVAQLGATASNSAGSVVVGGVNSASSSTTPTPASWDTGVGEGYTIWGGLRADGSILNIGSNVLFFADSGWNYANDVKTSCSPCEYNATQNFKGLSDPQCFILPLTSSCTGPNGAHGNPPSSITPGTEIQVVVVDTIVHQGSVNTLSRIGLATIKVLASCPANPSYLSQGTNGYCGTIMSVDAGVLNEGTTPTVPPPTSTPIAVVGNTN